MIFLNMHLFPRVFDALARREGQETTLPTLVSLTGLTPNQIQKAIANARNNHPEHAARISVVKPGRAWKFNAIAGMNGDDTVEEIIKEVDMGATHIWKHVLKVLQDNKSNIMSKEEIATVVTQTTDITMSPEQVATAMYTILRKPEIGRDVEVIWRSRSWRYVGKVKASSPKKAEVHESVSSSIRASVLRHFTYRPGVILFVDEIAADLGFTRRQVQSAVYSMVNEENSIVKNDFAIIQPGQSWRYAPNSTSGNGHASTPLERIPAQSLPVAALAARPSGATVNAQADPVSASPLATVSLPAPPKPAPVPAPAPVATPAPAPTSPAGGRLFEEIGQSTEGDILIREAETKEIYRAVRL